MITISAVYISSVNFMTWTRKNKCSIYCVIVYMQKQAPMLNTEMFSNFRFHYKQVLLWLKCLVMHKRSYCKGQKSNRVWDQHIQNINTQLSNEAIKKKIHFTQFQYKYNMSMHTQKSHKINNNSFWLIGQEVSLAYLRMQYPEIQLSLSNPITHCLAGQDTVSHGIMKRWLILYCTNTWYACYYDSWCVHNAAALCSPAQPYECNKLNTAEKIFIKPDCEKFNKKL